MKTIKTIKRYEGKSDARLRVSGRILSACVALLAVMAISCGSQATSAPPSSTASAEPRYGGTLFLRFPFDPANFDLITNNQSFAMDSLGGIYESLIGQDEEDNQKIVPLLAESWKFSEDGRKLTFKLRQTVKFHDGSVFSGRDAKATLDMILDPTVASTRGGGLTRPFIDKVELPEDYTLDVHLKAPNAAVLQALAVRWVAMMPLALLQNQTKREQTAVGTGPFVFKEYQPQVSIGWERNQQYWDSTHPYLNAVRIAVIRDDSTADAALATGRIMIGSGTLVTAKALVAQNPRLQLSLTPQNSQNNILFNQNRKPFDDPRVRKAVFLAVDRQDLGRRVASDAYELGIVNPLLYGEFALPAEEVLKAPGFRQPKDQDIAEAKRLLEAAGYKDGLATTLTARAIGGYPEFAQVLIPQLEKIGVRVKLEVVEPTAGLARIRQSDYDFAVQTLSQLTTDPGLTLQGVYFISGFSPWKNPPEIEALLAQQFAELDVNKRKPLIHQIQRYFLSGETGYAATAFGSQASVAWDYVKGPWSVFWQGNPYRKVWLDQ